MTMTSSGVLKQIIESAGLHVVAYRDERAKEARPTCVTIDEDVATSTELHGDTGDPNGHHGESEQLFVHLWQPYKDQNGKPTEDYLLARKLAHALRTAAPATYGPDDAPTRVYGLLIAGRARLIERDANVVHHTITVTMRRDA